jgi:hypothetical protein
MGVIPILCRNGESPIQLVKTPEQEQPRRPSTLCIHPGAEGIFMAVAAESLQFQSFEPETVNRRTDDILFNVRYMRANIVDRERRLIEPGVEDDVTEQNVTEIAEADVHMLGHTVYQHYDSQLGQYSSLGSGTFDNARRGYEAINPEDTISWFELGRRLEEVIDEGSVLQAPTNEKMRRGAVKIFASPESTPDEADPDVAASYGYDGRSMLRFQRLSANGQVKSMQNFSLFNVSAKVWAAYLGDRYGWEVEPTALGVMRFCNEGLFEYGDTNDILEDFIGGLIDYVGSDEQKASIRRQLDGFIHDQAELTQHAMYYGREKTEFQKDLAFSLYDYAGPRLASMMSDAYQKLNDEDKQQLAQRYHGSKLYVDDYVAELASKIKTLTIDNRAGLAAMNEYTVKRMASSIGLEATIALAERELAIQLAPEDMNEFMVRRNEQQIAESGVGCGGACSVSVVDLFSSEASIASKAGLSGTLYSSQELDKGSKCGCAKKGRKAKVISDGSNVVCTTCKIYKVGGRTGTLVHI